MTRLFVIATQMSLTVSLIISACAASNPDRDAEAFVEEVHAACGVQGGMVVHLGCGDGVLTAALRVGEGFTVHGLERDAEKVSAARAQVQSR